MHSLSVSCIFYDRLMYYDFCRAGSEAAPMLEGRIGDCCDDHPSEAAHHHGLLSPLQQSQFDSFSAVDSSLDSAQHSEAFKHGYAKASQILPYTPLRPVGHEPAQHTEVGPTATSNTPVMCCLLCSVEW